LLALPEAIAELLRRYPLPGDFAVSECFVDCTEVSGLAVHVVGIIASAPDGRSVSGSAGERGTVPFSRAYFELFERVAVLESERVAPHGSVPLSAARAPLEGRERWALPSAPGGAPWAYSRSNGVAVGRDFVSACQAARAELVERDRLLRAWYGQTLPRRLGLSPDPAWAALAPWYEVLAYEFPAAGERDGLDVVGVFGFPKVREAPLIYGAAADASSDGAARRAGAEALQRWAFLWGETIPDREPEFATAADFHQELYLWPPMHARLRDWLSGSHGLGAPLLAERGPVGAAPEFVELGVFPDLFVARAIPRSELPLVFGRGHPDAPRHAQEPFLVHPIA
jgi:hypothetical protein